MKRRKILFLSSIFILCALLTIPAFSQSQDSSNARRPFWNMRQRQMPKLNLTEAQKTKIQDLGFKYKSSMIDMHADLAKAMLDLKEVRSKDDISRDQVITAINKINKVRDQIALAKANHLMDIYSVLTPAQRKIAKKIFNRRHMQMRARRFDHRGMMGQGFKRDGRNFMERRGPGNFNGQNQPMGFLSPDNQQCPGNFNGSQGMAFASPDNQPGPGFDMPNDFDNFDAIFDSNGSAGF